MYHEELFEQDYESGKIWFQYERPLFTFCLCSLSQYLAAKKLVFKLKKSFKPLKEAFQYFSHYSIFQPSKRNLPFTWPQMLSSSGSLCEDLTCWVMVSICIKMGSWKCRCWPFFSLCSNLGIFRCFLFTFFSIHLQQFSRFFSHFS